MEDDEDEAGLTSGLLRPQFSLTDGGLRPAASSETEQHDEGGRHQHMFDPPTAARREFSVDGGHWPATNSGTEQHDEGGQYQHIFGPPTAARREFSVDGGHWPPTNSGTEQHDEGGQHQHIFGPSTAARHEFSVNSGLRPASSSGVEQHDEGPQRQHMFDPAIAARHEYLGELEDLPGVSMLEEGAFYYLPAFPLPDVVLLPGSTIPLKLSYSEELHMLEASLALPPPRQRVIVVMHQHDARRRRGCLDDLVGCTAEVRQMKRLPDGSAYIIVRGRQRVLRLSDGKPATKRWDAMEEGFRMHVQVLPEGNVVNVPRPIMEGAAHHQAWAMRPFDPKWLSAQALTVCGTCMPAAAQFLGGPLELSYWLAANLPLGTPSRVELLQCRSSTERLRRELDLMAELGAVRCRSCHNQLASPSDALTMTEEGTNGTFVNTHGFVHDMATFTHVSGVVYQGKKETEHSWFPGYSWTVCNCRGCYSHLGWRFDVVQPGLSPTQFWGLRRQALACVPPEENAAGAEDGAMAMDSEFEDSDDDGGGDGNGRGRGTVGVPVPANLRMRIQQFIDATFQGWRG